jgi:hypothetical protein
MPEILIPKISVGGGKVTEKNPLDSRVKTGERLTQRRRRRDFFEMEGAPKPKHLDKLVEKCPVRRILPNLETEEDNVLMKPVPPFRELRGVTSNSSPSQVPRSLSGPE